MPMTFDELTEMINEISDEQVEDKLETAEYGLEQLRETYAKPVEMTITEQDYIVSLSKLEKYVDTAIRNFFVALPNSQLDRNDVARAWLHPELIKVVEND